MNMSDSAQMKRVSIIVFGNADDFQPYKTLASALNDAGFDVRVLTNVEHESFLDDSPSFVHVPVYRSDAFQRLLQCETSKDFVTLMKNNMSMELQRLVKHDPRLQTAMAKCNSDEFMTLLQTMKLSQELCNSVLQDIRSFPPNLLIAGHHGEYFGSYYKHVLGKPSIGLLLRPGNGELQKSSFPHSWINLDNAVASLGCPPLASQFPNKKFDVKIMRDELGQFSSLALDPDFSVDCPQAIEEFIKVVEDMFFEFRQHDLSISEEDSITHELGQKSSLQKTIA